MRTAAVIVLIGWLAAPLAAAPPRRDPLASARILYNQRAFAAAIEAAEHARTVPGQADRADLVVARAYLERFRETGDASDLDTGRERLRKLDPGRLPPGERTEFIVGLGEALFFDQSFGAAADLFGSALSQGGEMAAEPRERVLDWWAIALDRDATARPEPDRRSIYRRVQDRMQDELQLHPASPVAAYWLVAVARAQGDVQGAWDAAQAAWVRATLAPDRGASLRADVDRFVLHVIVPERAKALAQPVDTVRREWEGFKDRWSR